MFDFVLQTAECLVNNQAKNNENESKVSALNRWLVVTYRIHMVNHFVECWNINKNLKCEKNYRQKEYNIK